MRPWTLVPVLLLAPLVGSAEAAVSAGFRSDGQAQSVVVRASADAYVTSSAPRRNRGRSKTLRLQRRPVARALLRFTVPRTTSVTGARLRLRVRSGSGRVSVHALPAGWRERRVTYARSPRPGRRIAAATVRRGWASIDVSRGFHAGRTLAFALTSSARRPIVLASRESGGTAPRLVLATEGAPETLVAAGDIANCASQGDEITAALLDGIPGTVAALGDLAYENGTPAEFAGCYGPSWGRHKARTRPTVGNHEYNTPAAAGYFTYFGSGVGNPTEGWYSYDVGAWHVVVLNSNCAFVSCAGGSPQETWLRADLQAHRVRCTLAYWHHPLFSSSSATPAVRPLFQALYDAGADLLLTGHAHNYQRFAPQTPTGAADAGRGIRQIVVGTGGAEFHAASGAFPNREAVNSDTLGVLRLTLFATRYEWQFVPQPGRTFTDSGSTSCH